MVRKRLNLVLWNADGVRSKMGELTQFLTRHAVDIMVISETKLNQNNRFRIRNYDIHRADRDGPGGGVAILIRQNIQHVALESIASIVENIAIKLLNGLTIRRGYVPPHINLNFDILDDLLPINQQTL